MKTRRIILSLLALLLLVLLIAGWIFFGPTTHQPENHYFYVRTGSTETDLRRELVDQKVLKSVTWFNVAARAIGFSTVKPGRYTIGKGMSLVNLVRMLRNGSQTPVSFSVTKLRTRESLAGRLAKNFEPDSVTMLRFLNSNDSLSDYSLDSNTAMAAVLPLTYNIRWNSSPSEIFSHFERAYVAFWNDERTRKAEALNLTPLQVTTLASIVDEETNAPSDKPNIASTYLNRLRTGMPLQADPTVKFALKNFGLRRILQGHLQTVSPYNTYLNKGLPPGPICTPAAATIDAVLDSPHTDYLYFVANSAMNGTHIFTSNYTDHLKYARLFQEELNKRNIH